MMYLGNIAEDATIDFMWSSNAADGSSITRATNGTISVYKGNSTTQTTAGITDTEDFDSLTGIHHCRIDTSADAFYATGQDYMVVLSGATIDGESVNAVLAHFSIQNRYPSVAQMQSGLATASALSTVAGYIDTEVAAIKAKTDNLPGSPAAVGSAMTLAPNAVNSTSIAASGISTMQSGLATSSALSIVAGYLDTEVAAILAKVNNLPSDPAVQSAVEAAITAAVSGLHNLSAADVNAEMVDVLTVDTFAEPSGVPAATSSLKDKINWLFMLARNKRITSGTADKVRNDADSADVGTAALSDDGTNFTRGEYS